MLRLVAFFAVIAVAFGSPFPKIVNGTDAKEGEIPYIISLRYSNSHTCGGSIIDATHVLTAAHCVYGRTGNPSAFSIQYGLLKIDSSSTNSITVTDIIYHPDYVNGGGYHNDVAVLTLASEIQFSANVVPAVLPAQGDPTPGDKDAVLAGWGYPYTGGNVMTNLQRVDITCYNDKDCETAHGGLADRKYHVCAGIPEGGKGQCSGDSGGPLNVNGVQVGVVSWSVKPCTIKGYPGVFAKVASYVDWIMDQTK